MKLTLAQVRKEIQKQYPMLNIKRGPGYYYFFSDHDKLAYALIEPVVQESATVMVDYCSHLSMENWLEAAHEVMTKAKEMGYEQ